MISNLHDFYHPRGAPIELGLTPDEFPSYRPGFYNGIFSLAMAGGLLTPGLMGYIASVYGVRMIMLMPLIGSVVVFVLLLLIWLESRLRAYNGRPASPAHSA